MGIEILGIAISALKEAAGIAKSIRNSKNSNIEESILLELQSKIIDAQTGVLDAKSEMLKIQEEYSTKTKELQNKLDELNNWETIKNNYEIKKFKRAHAYKKKGTKNKEVFCPLSFHHKKIIHLQDISGGYTRGTSHMCPECKNKFNVGVEDRYFD